MQKQQTFQLSGCADGKETGQGVASLVCITGWREMKLDRWITRWYPDAASSFCAVLGHTNWHEAQRVLESEQDTCLGRSGSFESFEQQNKFHSTRSILFDLRCRSASVYRNSLGFTSSTLKHVLNTAWACDSRRELRAPWNFIWWLPTTRWSVQSLEPQQPRLHAPRDKHKWCNKVKP